MNNLWLFVFFMSISFTVSSVLCIRCWECNSDINPACDDPFLKAPFDQMDCSAETNLQYQAIKEKFGNRTTQLCRKIVEKVSGKVRVIRKCGWLDDSRSTSCVRKVGNAGVSIQYCQCYEDGCNISSRNRSNLILLIFGLITSIFSFNRK